MRRCRPMLLPVSTMALGAVFSAVCVAGGEGHRHAADAGSLSSSTSSETPWQLDVRLGYQDVRDPVIPGFLTYDTHIERAGVGVQHLDIGRSFAGSVAGVRTEGRLVLSYHQNEVDIHEAWIRQPIGESAYWQVGQLLADIGQLNALHQHDWTFNDTPLYQRALWGGQVSEGAGRLAWQSRLSERWFLESGASLMATEQQQTEKASGAGLVNLAFRYRSPGVNARFKTDYYQARVNRRGLSLFNQEGALHSHGTTATEYFDGISHHIVTSLQVQQRSMKGQITLEAEYQRRTDHGDLYSASGQTTDVTAQADLESWGSYVSVAWQLPEGWLPVTLGVRQQWLGSDVVLTQPATDDLNQSVLNQSGELPQGISYLVRWHLNAGSLAVQYNQWSETDIALPEGSLTWQQSVAF